MSVNDIVPYGGHVFGNPGSRRYLVPAGSTGINPGEPVSKGLGSIWAVPAASGFGTVATDSMAGIAESIGTHTALLSGYVDVTPVGAGLWAIRPNSASTYGLATPYSQATYNALVGTRNLITISAGVYQLLASDNSTYGVVVEYQDVTKAEGRVLVSFRAGLSYLA